MPVPLLFIEVWCVILAFIPFICIKALIIKSIIKEDFKTTLFKLIRINFVTVIIGYLIQGLVRGVIFDFLRLHVMGTIYEQGEFINGLSGNVASAVWPMHLFAHVPIRTATELITSFILMFIIAAILEPRKIKQFYDEEDKQQQQLIPLAIFKANLISYCLLFIWITYYIAVN